MRLFAGDRRNRENVAYLDGVNFDGHRIVTTITVPRSERARYSFRVTSAAMSEAAVHLLQFGLRRIAQVHTHAKAFTGHSETDDQRAYSQREGSLSIVVPYYARKRPPLTACGIHVRTQAGWRELDAAEVGTEIVVVPSIVRLD